MADAKPMEERIMTRDEELSRLLEEHQPLTPEKIKWLTNQGLLRPQEVRLLTDNFSDPSNFERSDDDG
jgi:hypothetical protein